MQLSVCDIAAKLHVTEGDVIRWIEAEELPAFKIHDQYCIRRSEFLEWARSRQMAVPSEGPEIRKDESALLLTEALESGDIVYGLKGNDRDSVMRSVVETLEFSRGVDREH